MHIFKRSIDFSKSLFYTIRMHFSKKDIFTIPNIMSYFRILLVPAFCVAYVNSRSLKGYLWSIVIVALSALTDVFDGIVARKTGQVTDLGKILDPIADKAMQFAMLFCVVIRYRLVLILLLLYAVKELVSLAFSSYLFAHDRNIGGAQWYGKLCTVVFYGVMLAFIVLPRVGRTAEIIMICGSAFFMLLAFVMYMTAYIRMLHELRSEQHAEIGSGDDQK